ncbi:hypothetical protein D3C81_2315200 [compost metagenome]
MSARSGRREPSSPFTRGEQSARARLADISMASVTRLAPEAMTPRPIPGKMKELLHWAMT